MTLTTTLKEIRKHNPCRSGWETLLLHLGKTKADDEPLPMRTILDANGVDDFLWCLRALPAQHDNAVRLLNCDIAERALRFVPDGEDRPRLAIETARRFARGEGTGDDLYAASDAASSAASSAASDAASDAAWAAAWAAACDSAWAAACDSACNAAWVVARAAACNAERAEQTKLCHAWLDQFEAAS